MALPLNFKVKKTTTPEQDKDIARIIDLVETYLGRKLEPTDNIFHTFYFLEVEWAQYQHLYQVLKNESITKPYIVID
ncbi:hypothetical protein ACFPVY_03975 [Flavobacterium qiangtangense]|uniref:Uncharacterized protein n=1 Tax=Flavobacterium qiangtangense TaxID=1442595 RepID=A0ABW1PKH1_9FLAO